MIRDDFHVHIPTAPFSSVCSFRTQRPKAHIEGKDTDKFALVEVKEKSLNEQEEQAQLWFSNYCFR